MYVCICNALREKELQAAAADPAVKGVSCVFKRCSTKPQCGRCLPDVADMIAATPMIIGAVCPTRWPAMLPRVSLAVSLITRQR